MLYWLVVSTPLKNMKVNWDYYSQHMGSHKIHVPNHQPAIVPNIINHSLVGGAITIFKNDGVRQWEG
jgi:hypothetical protein